MSLVHIGKPQEQYNAAGTRVLKYTLEMYHEGLKEHKLISAPDLSMLRNKTGIQQDKWTEKWGSIQDKLKLAAQKQANAEEAENLTHTAEEAVEEIDNLLIHTLAIDDTIDWDSLKLRGPFPDEKPLKPPKQKYYDIPPKPDQSEEMFTPKFTIFEKMFKGLRDKKIAEYDDMLSGAIEVWESKKKEIENQNRQIDADYNETLSLWEVEVSKWEKRRATFIKKQEVHNLKIDTLKATYFEKNSDSVLEYCEMVLNNSQYPDSFSKDFEIEYNPDTGILIVEYQLPNIEMMPKIKAVKYLASKNELKETYFTEAQITKMFEGAIYKITLRSIHELFEADKANALESISFNGWVRAINKATGKEENNCILSLQVKKEEFLQIDLGNVDPKMCFRKLKGVAGSKLSTLTPIKPILQIDKTDKRFVASYSVSEGLDASANLAAMDWEDFEHLIRELFENEFKSSGGDVKVTQASRDGGVDAIAFDPDPIRGGKIVIQAKRYTNTVGVSAVRDLYGTVMNEGATKGILVTTADYGPDAYEFAKGKPLTLLSGSNLLHLLAKHGTHAKIDLKEAKKILAEK